MPDATELERFDTALRRIETAAARLHDARARAEARCAVLDGATSEALTALDALIAADRAPASAPHAEPA